VRRYGCRARRRRARGGACLRHHAACHLQADWRLPSLQDPRLIVSRKSASGRCYAKVCTFLCSIPAPFVVLSSDTYVSIHYTLKQVIRLNPTIPHRCECTIQRRWDYSRLNGLWASGTRSVWAKAGRGSGWARALRENRDCCSHDTKRPFVAIAHLLEGAKSPSKDSLGGWWCKSCGPLFPKDASMHAV
jgi:hypothetical protein